MQLSQGGWGVELDHAFGTPFNCFYSERNSELSRLLSFRIAQHKN